MAITRQREETFRYGAANITVEYKQVTTNMPIKNIIESVSAISIDYDETYMRMYERDFLAFAELVDYVSNVIRAKGGEK